METLKKIWNFFDGHKTEIAAYIFVVSTLLYDDQFISQKPYDLLVIISKAIGLLGGAHKLVKFGGYLKDKVSAE